MRIVGPKWWARRRYVWRQVRLNGRYPNGDEWHYLVFGRWSHM